jgi:hypothetical protein
VAVWRWDVNEDKCSICRAPLDATCGTCKTPGDDCPLSTCARSVTVPALCERLRVCVRGCMPVPRRRPACACGCVWRAPSALSVSLTAVAWVCVCGGGGGGGGPVLSRCNHCFHMHCIDRSLRASVEQSQQERCPVCRSAWEPAT